MRRERFNLEEQVGGLIDHEERPERRRQSPKATAPESEPPRRYGLTKRATLAIRASRASGERTHRRVA